MAEYQQARDALTGQASDAVIRTRDGAFIPKHPGNIDWQEFEVWLAEGNTPDALSDEAPS